MVSTPAIHSTWLYFESYFANKYSIQTALQEQLDQDILSLCMHNILYISEYEYV